MASILPSTKAPTTQTQTTPPPIQRKHPLHNVTPTEISQASSIALSHIRQQKDDPNLRVRFKNISLHEPPKALLLPYLDAEAADVTWSERPFVPRCISLIYACHNEREFGEIVVSLDGNSVVGIDMAGRGMHSSMDR